MNADKLNAIGTCVIAFSTVVGVAGALGYYFSQIKAIGLWGVIFMEIAYFLAMTLATWYFVGRVK